MHLIHKNLDVKIIPMKDSSSKYIFKKCISSTYFSLYLVEIVFSNKPFVGVLQKRFVNVLEKSPLEVIGGLQFFRKNCSTWIFSSESY